MRRMQQTLKPAISMGGGIIFATTFLPKLYLKSNMLPVPITFWCTDKWNEQTGQAQIQWALQYITPRSAAAQTTEITGHTSRTAINIYALPVNKTAGIDCLYVTTNLEPNQPSIHIIKKQGYLQHSLSVVTLPHLAMMTSVW